MKLSLILATSLLLVGCNFRPLRPGFSTITSPSGTIASVKQSENPKSETTQKIERREEVTAPNGEKKVVTETANTTIGSAQKDTAREMAAKLGSLRGVVWVGIALFIFGAASAFWPPLKLVVGSLTTSAACCAAGVGLIVLPSLIVGHEVLIMAVGAGGVFIYWWAHRHGGLAATVALLKKDL